MFRVLQGSGLVAAFVLIVARPFEIGESVAIGDDEGTVTDITIINTRIRNPNGEEVVIPNENVLNATVTNRTSLDRLRLSVDIGVDYDAGIKIPYPQRELLGREDSGGFRVDQQDRQTQR